jgi:hypothetical protein
MIYGSQPRPKLKNKKTTYPRSSATLSANTSKKATTMQISDEAVEAAARAMAPAVWGPRVWKFAAHGETPTAARDRVQQQALEDARQALEAAAPYMFAQRAVASVLALHREMECRDEDGEPVGGSYCEECKDLDDHSGERVHEVYPCMTVREIRAALAGQETYTAMRDRIEAQANPYRSQA